MKSDSQGEREGVNKKTINFVGVLLSVCGRRGKQRREGLAQGVVGLHTCLASTEPVKI